MSFRPDLKHAQRWWWALDETPHLPNYNRAPAQVQTNLVEMIQLQLRVHGLQPNRSIFFKAGTNGPAITRAKLPPGMYTSTIDVLKNMIWTK